MGQHLQRFLGPAPSLQPGQFTVETASGRPAVCCKACGTIAEIQPTHRVLRGGMVVPVWVCEQPTCGAMDFLTLDDIEEPVV
jgi:hypothetical protein